MKLEGVWSLLYLYLISSKVDLSNQTDVFISNDKHSDGVLHKSREFQEKVERPAEKLFGVHIARTKMFTSKNVKNKVLDIVFKLSDKSFLNRPGSQSSKDEEVYRHVRLTSKLLANELLNINYGRHIMNKGTKELPWASKIIGLSKQTQKSIENIGPIRSSISAKELQMDMLFPGIKTIAFHNFDMTELNKNIVTNFGLESNQEQDYLFDKPISNTHKSNLFEKDEKHLKRIPIMLVKRSLNSNPLNSTINSVSPSKASDTSPDLLASNQPLSTSNPKAVNEMSVETTSSIISVITESLSGGTQLSTQKPELISTKANVNYSDNTNNENKAMKVISAPTMVTTQTDTVSYQPVITSIPVRAEPSTEESNSISTTKSISSLTETKSPPLIISQSTPSILLTTLIPQPFYATTKLPEYETTTLVNGNVNPASSILVEAVTQPLNSNTKSNTKSESLFTTSTDVKVPVVYTSTVDDTIVTEGSGEIPSSQVTGMLISDTSGHATTQGLGTLKLKISLGTTTESPSVNAINSNFFANIPTQTKSDFNTLSQFLSTNAPTIESGNDVEKNAIQSTIASRTSDQNLVQSTTYSNTETTSNSNLSSEPITFIQSTEGRTTDRLYNTFSKPITVLPALTSFIQSTLALEATTGQRTHSPVSESTVLTTKVPESTVLTTKVPESTVLTTKVPESTVLSTKVPESTVLTTNSPESTVLTTKVQESTVMTTKVPESTILTTKVPESTVLSTKVPKSTVLTTNSPESTVMTTKVPESTVMTTKVPESTVMTTKQIVKHSKPYSTMAFTKNTERLPFVTTMFVEQISSVKPVTETHSSTIIERSSASDAPMVSMTTELPLSKKTTLSENDQNNPSSSEINPESTSLSKVLSTTPNVLTTTLKALPTTASTISTTSSVLPVETYAATPTAITPSTTSPEPEPEAENGIVKPPNGHSHATTEPPSFAEPGPDWLIAKEQWSFAWEVHLYFFGLLFTVIGLYCLVSVGRLWSFNRLLSKKYFVTLNLLVLLMCALRAVYLLVDGYNSNSTFHPVVDYLLYSTAFPCLTSAFSILMFALLQATRMRLVPPSVQKFSVLIVIIIIHFVISIATDVVVGLVVGMRIMLFVCQLVFILWGIFLFFGYAYIFRQVYGSAVKRQKMFYYSGSPQNSQNSQAKNKLTLSLAVKITFSTAIFGLITVGLEIYGIAGVYGIFSGQKPSPWPWWSYHTVLRLTECLMCLTISYIASQPFRYRNNTLCDFCFLCAPCINMCSCDRTSKFSDNIGWSDTEAVSNNISAPTSSGKKRIKLCETADIIPIVVQPSSTEESRPNSLLIIENGYIRFPTDNDINKIADSYNGIRRPVVSNGIVNGAYQAQDITNQNTLNEVKLTQFKRKSSMASSEPFKVASSISLADSMASELDKAFKSMMDEEQNSLNCSGVHETSRFINKINDIQAYVESQPSNTLRRSNSAAGDINIDMSSRAKLFRSHSENSGIIRTKQFDKMRYMSLLDLEQAIVDEDGCQSDDTIDVDYSREDVYVKSPEILRQCSIEVDASKGLLNKNSDQVTEL